MERYEQCTIKSFKHNGHIHRQWQQNWLVPDEALAQSHHDESMIVLINRQTPILESDGKQWISRVPAVSFFIPRTWFNVVALLETSGVRYYCNVASPPYLHEGVLTYIDYDLDVIMTANGSHHIVDQDEYERHKQLYHYPHQVQKKVQEGLQALLRRIQSRQAPFEDGTTLSYYEHWLAHVGEVEQ